jgi:hypothetical protein
MGAAHQFVNAVTHMRQPQTGDGIDLLQRHLHLKIVFQGNSPLSVG